MGLWTIRNFEKVGVREGWDCLEIAGGSGSIAQWLCRHVGASGHVVATDLQPRLLEAINASNLEVWRHDILRDPLSEKTFDLVHARAVLSFLPRPAETITKISTALKPDQPFGTHKKRSLRKEAHLDGILFLSRTRNGITTNIGAASLNRSPAQ